MNNFLTTVEKEKKLPIQVAKKKKKYLSADDI